MALLGREVFPQKIENDSSFWEEKQRVQDIVLVQSISATSLSTNSHRPEHRNLALFLSLGACFCAQQVNIQHMEAKLMTDTMPAIGRC